MLAFDTQERYFTPNIRIVLPALDPTKQNRIGNNNDEQSLDLVHMR